MDINVIYGQGAANNAAPAGFYTALNYVVSYFDQLFTNNVTININVGYGSVLDPYTGKYSRLSSSDLGESYDNNETTYSYAQLKAALLAENAAGANTLPATPPFSGGLYMGSAEAKSLGLAGPSAVLDGAIGVSASAAWSFAPNATPTGNEYYLVGVLEHEITEVMGRVSYVDGAGDYGVADLYRYSAAGVRSDTPGGNGSTAYFSINNGITHLGSWNNQTSNGDLADWYPQGPAPNGNDAFNDYSNPGVINALSSSDLTLMAALGWSTTLTPAITALVGQPANGSTVEVQGTGQAGDTVMLYQGNTIVGSGTVASNGMFDITTTTTFADGVVSLTATESNGAMTSATSSPFSVNVVPNAPSLVAASEPLSGPIAVHGTGEVGDHVTVYQGSSVVGSGTVGSNGTFDITTTAAFVNGLASLTATETDSSALTSAPSAALEISNTPGTLTATQINEIYLAVLQHNASPASTTNWLSVDVSTGDAATIFDIVNLPETQFNVDPVFQIVKLATGNAPTAHQLAGWVPYVESNGLLQGQSQSNPLLDQMAFAFVASDSFGQFYNNGIDVNPNSAVTTQEMQLIIKAATGVAATQAQLTSWVGTGLSVDQVFVDFALGDQYTAASQSTIQQYLTTLADNGAGISSQASIVGSAATIHHPSAA